MVLAWIYEGNNYRKRWGALADNVPIHSQLPLEVANDICITTFPSAILWSTHGDSESQTIGTGWGELLPGVYEYLGRGGDNRSGRRLLPLCTHGEPWDT